MDYELEPLGKKIARLKNLLHGMVDELTVGQTEELYRVMKRLYFPDRF